MAAEDAEIRSLGLVARNRLELAERIHKGVSYEKVRRFQEATSLSESRLQRVARIPPRTWIRRKRDGKFSPEESERIARIARLFEHAESVLGSKEAAKRWLEAPNLGLGNAVPLEAAATELGAQVVEDFLARIEFGVYS